MTTLNKVLIALLVVQLGLVALCTTRQEAGTIGELEPLLPDYDAESVSRVQIYSATDGGDTTKPAIDLQKKDGAWVLAGHFDYPADGTAVTSLVGKIATMQARGPATTTSAGHKRLKVADDDYVRKVVLTNAAGETTVYFGISPKFKKLNVRTAGSDDTYLVQQLTAQDANDQVSGWIDPVFVMIPVDTMTALTVENSKGIVSLERDADKRWQLAEGAPLPAGKTAPVSIKQKAVDDIAGKLGKIEIEDVVGTEAKPEFGLDNPAARVTIGMAGESSASGGGTDESEAPAREVRVVEIGAEKDGAYYVRVLDKPYIVTVKTASLKDVVDLEIGKLVDDATPPPVTPKP